MIRFLVAGNCKYYILPLTKQWYFIFYINFISRGQHCSQDGPEKSPSPGVGAGKWNGNTDILHLRKQKTGKEDKETWRDIKRLRDPQCHRDIHSARETEASRTTKTVGKETDGKQANLLMAKRMQRKGLGYRVWTKKIPQLLQELWGSCVGLGSLPVPSHAGYSLGGYFPFKGPGCFIVISNILQTFIFIYVYENSEQFHIQLSLVKTQLKVKSFLINAPNHYNKACDSHSGHQLRTMPN